MDVEAIYHNGQLELKTPLPLKEGQTVWVSVRETPDPLPEPTEFSPKEWARLDAEFDELLAEFRATSDPSTETDVAANIDEAIRSVRDAHRR